VIQALYFCQPFREKILEYRQHIKKSDETFHDNLLSCLADLFSNISSQKRRVGTIAPKRFITKLKRENELFDNFMQQDAHEFFNFLLNAIHEALAEDKKRETSEPTTSNSNGTLKSSSVTTSLPHKKSLFNSSNDPATAKDPTWIQGIFQGTLVNETRCLNCETVSSKDEDFLDLSVDIENNVSISHCLRNFSNMETLSGDQKYYCDVCCSKQEAYKRMRIKKLPHLLALHLKRFKYVEQLSRYTKLSYRVLFPMELRLPNVRDDAANNDQLYDLVAVVVHCGSTPNRGHYITLVKSHTYWLLFDDDVVDKIDDHSFDEFFGLSDINIQKNSESAYILFYQTRL